MQIPESSLRGGRPASSGGGKMYKHGSYERYASPSGGEKIPIQRFLDPSVGNTASVLPKGFIPYRPVSAAKLEAHFDQQSEASTPEPTASSNEVEAGVLGRAWKSFTQRTASLRRAFDQLLTPNLTCPKALWKGLRLAKHSLADMLGLLFEKHNTSLLKDYRCAQGGTALKII